jgi:hypothetical protein
MTEKKSLVEEAIIQMKNLEEIIAENAKGILASTMKGEISELVKESLSEQEEEDEIDADVEMNDMDTEDDESDSEDMFDMDTDNEEDFTPNMGQDVIDMRSDDYSDEDILKVFNLAGPEDKIIVTKDEAGNINLKDDDKEYMIVGEGDEDGMSMDEEDFEFDMSDDEFDMSDEDEDEETEDSIEDIMSKVFSEEEEEEEENESYHSEDEEEEDDDEEIVYEIEFDEEMHGDTNDDEDENETFENMEEYMMSESKKSFKPKGMGIGNPSKAKKYPKKPNLDLPVKKMKQGTKGVGMGKPEFEYKEGENLDGKMKTVKKMETKEASRTFGKGSKSGRGLRKAITPNRNLTFESTKVQEVQILREKNEEYRKALNVFRNKLNEVAVFNSNLAYATRLFTEHSTSKQEKINILRRFDNVETIKESKNLYKQIKDELTSVGKQSMNESFESKIEKAPSTGSAANLIESKTYENPQFLRMKDLMSKLK